MWLRMRDQLLLQLLVLLMTSAESDAQRHWRRPPHKVSHERAAFPNPEFDDWQPIGPGDPLKNDPTFQYAPPVLAREPAHRGGWPIRPRNPPVHVVQLGGANRRRDGPLQQFFQFHRRPVAPPRNQRRPPRPGGGLNYIAGPQFGAPASERHEFGQHRDETQQFGGQGFDNERESYQEEEPTRLFAGQSNYEPQREFVPQRDTFEDQAFDNEQQTFNQQHHNGFQEQYHNQDRIEEQSNFEVRQPERQEGQTFRPNEVSGGEIETTSPIQQPQQPVPKVTSASEETAFVRFPPPPPRKSFVKPAFVQVEAPKRLTPEPSTTSERLKPISTTESFQAPETTSRRPRPTRRTTVASTTEVQRKKVTQSTTEETTHATTKKTRERETERTTENTVELTTQRPNTPPTRVTKPSTTSRRTRPSSSTRRSTKAPRPSTTTRPATTRARQTTTVKQTPPSTTTEKTTTTTKSASTTERQRPPTTTTMTTTTTKRQPPSRTTTKRQPPTTTTKKRQTTTVGTTTERTTTARTTTQRRPKPNVILTTPKRTINRSRVPLSSRLKKRPSRPDISRFSSRPHHKRPTGLFRRTTTSRPKTTSRRPVTTSRTPPTTRRTPSTTPRRSVTTTTTTPRQQGSSLTLEQRRQQLNLLISRDRRPSRRPRPSATLQNNAASTEHQTTVIQALEPTAATTTVRPSRPPVTVKMLSDSWFKTAPFPMQHPLPGAVAKAPYVHQSGYSRIKVFGINVDDRKGPKKPGKKHKKPIYPIHIEHVPKSGPVKQNTSPRHRPAFKVTTSAPTAAPSSPPRPTVKLATMAPVPKTTTTTTTTTTRTKTTPTTTTTTKPTKLSSMKNKKDDDVDMMKKMYYEVDADQAMSGSGGSSDAEYYDDASSFADLAVSGSVYPHGPFQPSIATAPIQFEAEPYSVPEYEPVPPPVNAFYPSSAPINGFRTNTNNAAPPVRQEVNEPPFTKKEIALLGQPKHPARPELRPHSRPAPAGASSWMTGLLSSLFGDRSKQQPPPKQPQLETPSRPAHSPVSLLSGLFGAGSENGPDRRRPQSDPYGFAPATDDDPLSTSGSEIIPEVTGSNGEPLRPPAALRNVPALAGLFGGLPADERPRFTAPVRAKIPKTPSERTRPVFFTKRQKSAEERVDRAEVSHPFEYVETLEQLQERLPPPEMISTETERPKIVPTRVPVQQQP